MTAQTNDKRMGLWGSLSHNVRLTLIIVLVRGVSVGIWSQCTLGPLLLALTDSNTYAGYAAGVEGTVKLLVSVPAGWLADRYRRDQVLKGAACIGLIAAALILLALQLANRIDAPTWHVTPMVVFYWLAAGMVTMGTFGGALFPAWQALYADSIPTGDRSRYEMYRHVIQSVASAMGPLCNIVLFYWLGNTWTVPSLATICTIGILIGLLPTFLTFLFDDSKALRGESEALPEEKLQPPRPAGKSTGWWPISNPHWIPYLVITGDVIHGLAEGIAGKFFSVFFQKHADMSPMHVHVIYAIAPLLLAVCTVLSQRASRLAGRLQVAVGCRALGTGCLLAMAALKGQWGQQGLLLGGLYVGRTALMGSGGPLTKAVLMDCVHKEARGRWNIFESITAFGWSGSALIGGLLVEHTGFQVTFLVTASVHALGCLFLFMAMPMVPLEHSVPPPTAPQDETRPLLL